MPKVGEHSASRDPHSGGPLDGYRIVDLTSMISGPFATMMLGDQGADVVISNGAINLAPDKDAVFREINRVLKPGGRLQVADILVDKPIPESAKRNIELWTG